MPKKHILFLVLEYGELPEILKLCHFLKQHKDCKISVWFVKKYYKNLAVDTGEVLKVADHWMDYNGTSHQLPFTDVIKNTELNSSVLNLKSTKKQTYSPCKEILVGLINSYAKLKAMRKRSNEIAQIIAQLKPDILIVGQDSLGKELSFAIQSANSRNIPTIIAPFAMFNREELLYYALGNEALHVKNHLFNTCVARLFPQWCTSVSGVEVLREKPETIIAVELLGLCKGDPWVPCTEPVKYILCDSNITYQNYLSLGIPKDRIVLVGNSAADRINRISLNEKKLWKESVGIAVEAPLLLCGWPVNMFPWLGERVCSFANYDEVALFWCNMLEEIRSNYGWEVVLTIHPKTLEQEIAYPQSYNFPCIRGNVETLIASCDMFTTLNGSSITAWALSTHKPTILFDCFSTQYKDFNAIAGCEIYENSYAYQERMTELCESSQLLTQMHEKMKESTTYRHSADGSYEEKLSDFFDSLLKNDII